MVIFHCYVTNYQRVIPYLDQHRIPTDATWHPNGPNCPRGAFVTSSGDCAGIEKPGEMQSL